MACSEANGGDTDGNETDPDAKEDGDKDKDEESVEDTNAGSFTPVFNELGEEINFSSRVPNSGGDDEDWMSSISETALMTIGVGIAVFCVLVFIFWKIRAAYISKVKTAKVGDLNTSIKLSQDKSSRMRAS